MGSENDFAERIAKLEIRVTELEPRLKGFMNGKVDNMNRDFDYVMNTLEELKTDIKKLDTITRGDRGDNGLVSMVNTLIRTERSRNRLTLTLLIGLCVTVAGSLVAKFLGM